MLDARSDLIEHLREVARRLGQTATEPSEAMLGMEPVVGGNALAELCREIRQLKEDLADLLELVLENV